MARTKKVNEKIVALRQSFDERAMRNRQIDREFAEKAREAKEAHEAGLFKTLFVDYAYVGDSEIANSLGYSRSTIVNWRKAFNETYGYLYEGARVEVEAQGAPIKVTHMYVGDALGDWPVIDFAHAGEVARVVHANAIFTISGNEPVADAMDTARAILKRSYSETEVYENYERPDWLDDDTIKAAFEAEGKRLNGAPWND